MTKKHVLKKTPRDKWEEHRFWLHQAAMMAARPPEKGGSPHPSVRVGALLVDSQGRKIAAATNRLPKGVACHPLRVKDGAKSLWFNCAEQLALMQALRLGKSVRGARLYVTLEPCATCAGMISELKIASVYYSAGSKERYGSLKPKWRESIDVGLVKLKEAGVRVTAIEL